MTFKTMQQHLLKQERSKPDGQNIVYNISWLWNYVHVFNFDSNVQLFSNFVLRSTNNYFCMFANFYKIMNMLCIL